MLGSPEWIVAGDPDGWSGNLRDLQGYLALLDGEAQEQVFFDGTADVHGTDKRQGDCRLPLRAGQAPPDHPSYCAGPRTLKAGSEEYVCGLADYLAAGIPVLTVYYALKKENAAYAYAQHALPLHRPGHHALAGGSERHPAPIPLRKA